MKNCQWCQKRLRKFWLILDDQTRARLGEPLEKKIGKKTEYYKSFDEGVWDNYDYNGNNYFCSLRCGFRYGVWALTPAKVK